MEYRADLFEGQETMNMSATVAIAEQNIGAGAGAINGGEWVEGREDRIKDGVESNLVAVSETAPGCCIDGRPCVSCMNGEPTEPRYKVAGGPLITAYAGLKMTGYFKDQNLSQRQELELTDGLLEAAGIKSGAHCDQAAADAHFENLDGSPKTGCGAADKLPAIIERTYDERDTVQAITAALLNDAYHEQAAAVADKDTVMSSVAGWRSTDMVDVIGGKSGSNVEILKSEQTPTGGHREAAVVAIYKDGVTLDRDAFTEQTGEQVFVVNMSYIEKIANALADGPHATEQAAQLKHAMVAYQAATYLTLCDGSQRLVTVK